MINDKENKGLFGIMGHPSMAKGWSTEEIFNDQVPRATSWEFKSLSVTHDGDAARIHPKWKFDRRHEFHQGFDVWIYRAWKKINGKVYKAERHYISEEHAKTDFEKFATEAFIIADKIEQNQ